MSFKRYKMLTGCSKIYNQSKSIAIPQFRVQKLAQHLGSPRSERGSNKRYSDKHDKVGQLVRHIPTQCYRPDENVSRIECANSFRATCAACSIPPKGLLESEVVPECHLYTVSCYQEDPRPVEFVLRHGCKGVLQTLQAQDNDKGNPHVASRRITEEEFARNGLVVNRILSVVAIQVVRCNYNDLKQA